MTPSRRSVAAVLATAFTAAIALLAPTAASAAQTDLFDLPQPSVSPAPDTYPNAGVRILFLGDSITGSPGCWRAPVWGGLTDAGSEVDMVGTRQDDECGGYTNAAGKTWDPDNSGIGGENTSGMFVRIVRDGLIARTTPDVVVMLLGTNDFWSGRDAEYVLRQYGVLVDAIRDDAPGASIVVGTVLPMSAEACPTCQEQIDVLNAGLHAWADETTTEDSPVTIAVLGEEFDPEEHTYDGVHPNDDGNRIVAAAFLPAIAAAVDAREETEVPWPSLLIGLAAIIAGLIAVWWWRTHGAARELDDMIPEPEPDPKPKPRTAKPKPRTTKPKQ